jgi:uncharacterized protein
MPDIVVSFFVLGLMAGLVKSDLEVPRAAYDVLSLMLMLTIGLKGGMALHGNVSVGVLVDLAVVAAVGAVIPLLLLPLLRGALRLSLADSASLAAHYGSVSAGTFAVALAYAETHQLLVGAEVTLYLVMMELPAILVAILLFQRLARSAGGRAGSAGVGSIWREALTNRGVILLAGGVVIGLLYGPVNGSSVTALFTHAFTAVLALFLLDMGLTAAGSLRPLPWQHWRVVLFALLIPLPLATLGLLVGVLVLQLPAGSAVILTALVASASYIAAPAAVRTAIPGANIGLAMLAALGLTFPVNVLIGIPLYHRLVEWMVAG